MLSGTILLQIYESVKKFQSLTTDSMWIQFWRQKQEFFNLPAKVWKYKKRQPEAETTIALTLWATWQLHYQLVYIYTTIDDWRSRSTLKWEWKNLFTCQTNTVSDLGQAKKTSTKNWSFTSVKELEFRKSFSFFSSESNKTMWLGKDQFFANSDAKPYGSNKKRSDSSGVPLCSLMMKLSTDVTLRKIRCCKCENFKKETNYKFKPWCTVQEAHGQILVKSRVIGCGMARCQEEYTSDFATECFSSKIVHCIFRSSLSKDWRK